MTGESSSVTDRWAEENDARFPYAYDKSGSLSRWFGVRGIPDAVLIDPSGRIVWRGHPGTLDESTVEASLEGALTVPIYEWPGYASKVKKALFDRDYADALEEAAGISGEELGPSIQEVVRNLVQSKMERLESAWEEGDYLRVEQLVGELEKGLRGTEHEARIQELDDALRDSEVKRVIKGQEKLAKYAEEAGELRKVDDAVDLMDDIRDLADDYPGTIVERRALELVREIDRRRPNLK